MRAMITRATTPPPAQAAWRSTKYHDDPYSSRATTDDADMTMTRPSRLKTVMRKASAMYRPERPAGAGGVRALGGRRRAPGAPPLAPAPRPRPSAGGLTSRPRPGRRGRDRRVRPDHRTSAEAHDAQLAPHV